jgi:hypothetical protein
MPVSHNKAQWDVHGSYLKLIEESEKWSRKNPPTDEEKTARTRDRRSTPRLTQRERNKKKIEMMKKSAIKKDVNAKVEMISRTKKLPLDISKHISSYAAGKKTKKRKSSKKQVKHFT